MVSRDRLILVLRYGIGIGVVVATAVYVFLNWQEFAVIFSIHIWRVVILVGLAFIHSFISAAQFASLYRALGVPMGIVESFFLSTLGGFFALVVPQATYLTKAVYLKQRYALPYSKTPAILLGSLAVFIIMGMAVIGLSLTILATTENIDSRLAWLAIPFSLGIVLLWRLHIPDHLLIRMGRAGNMLRLFLEGWSTLRQDRRCLVRISFYQFLMFVVSGMSFSVAFKSIGKDVSPLVGTVLAASTSFTNLISLTPANLGVQEAVVGYLAGLTGHAFVEGAVASMILRIIGLITILLVTPIAYYCLFWQRGIHMGKHY